MNCTFFARKIAVFLIVCGKLSIEFQCVLQQCTSVVALVDHECIFLVLERKSFLM